MHFLRNGYGLGGNLSLNTVISDTFLENGKTLHKVVTPSFGSFKSRMEISFTAEQSCAVFTLPQALCTLYELSYFTFQQLYEVVIPALLLGIKNYETKRDLVSISNR